MAFRKVISLLLELFVVWKKLKMRSIEKKQQFSDFFFFYKILSKLTFMPDSE